MSPEQVRGQPAGPGSDVFSFGAVLYEMLTGRRAFKGDSAAETMHAILKDEPPDLLETNQNLPQTLERIVRHCLEKRPDQRFHSAHDLAFDLKAVSMVSDTSRVTGLGPTITPARRRWLLPAVAGLILLIAGTLGIGSVLRRSFVSKPSVSAYRQITTDGGPTSSGGLWTDGARIYFTKHVGAQTFPAQVSTSGGESSVINVALSQPFVWDLMPDHSRLLVGSWSGGPPGPNASLWVLPVLGGSPRRIGTVMAQDASWSPDGKHIAVAAAHDVSVMDVDGTHMRKLTSASGWPYCTMWSPDGKRLSFTVQDPTRTSFSLWEVATDTGNTRQLLPGWNEPAHESCGFWTADGRYFLFFAERGGGDHIWAIREKSGLFRQAGEPVQLTTGPISFERAAVSSDGHKLYVIGSRRRGELTRYDLGTHQWLAYCDGLSAEQLDFSGDGTRIAYVSYPEGDLWRSRTDGRDRVQLTAAPMTAVLPRWSPDASKIVFGGQRPGEPWQIYMVPADGGNPERVIRVDRDVDEAVWSPDGRSLAIGTAAGPATREIDLVDLDSREVQTLAGSHGLTAPRWSPDGHHLVAVRDDWTKLVVFSFATQKWTDLAEVKQIGWPHWSHDGRHVYFASSSVAIFSVRLSDRLVQRVASLAGVQLATGTFWWWMGLAPDDSPLALRETGADDIYALDLELP